MRKALKKHYKGALDELKQQLKRPITEVERDMHELRRDVLVEHLSAGVQRFYQPRAERTDAGSICQIRDRGHRQSPFNQLPQVEGATHILYLNTHAYYAMSWLIAELSALKDQGLRLLALTDWLVEHKNSRHRRPIKPS